MTRKLNTGGNTQSTRKKKAKPRLMFQSTFSGSGAAFAAAPGRGGRVPEAWRPGHTGRLSAPAVGFIYRSPGICAAEKFKSSNSQAGLMKLLHGSAHADCTSSVGVTTDSCLKSATLNSSCFLSHLSLRSRSKDVHVALCPAVPCCGKTQALALPSQNGVGAGAFPPGLNRLGLQVM